MWPVTPCWSISAFQTDAIFASKLQRTDEPGAAQVRQAAVAAIQTFGCVGCAERVAQEFGDHPETAVTRMRWARAVAREAFGDSASRPGGRADAGALLDVRGRLPGRQPPGSREAMV